MKKSSKNESKPGTAETERVLKSEKSAELPGSSPNYQSQKRNRGYEKLRQMARKSLQQE